MATAFDESDADEGVMIPGVAFTWSSSDDDVATVTPDKDNSAMATVKAVGPGTAKITASAQGEDSNEVSVTVFETLGVERRLTASGLPYSVEIAADSSSVGASDSIEARLEQLGADGETWADAADGIAVTFTVLSGPLVIAGDSPTTSGGTVSVAITALSDPTADPPPTGVNGVGTAIVRISSQYASPIYVEVEVTKASS